MSETYFAKSMIETISFLKYCVANESSWHWGTKTSDDVLQAMKKRYTSIQYKMTKELFPVTFMNFLNTKSVNFSIIVSSYLTKVTIK